MTTKQILLLLSFAVLVPCHAGDAGAPNIVWVNLSEPEEKRVNMLIADIVSADKPMCWNAYESHIYMKKRPNGVTNKLVREALVNRDTYSLHRLNAILSSYRDKYTKGLDGVIAYASGDQPKMIGLTTGDRLPKTDVVAPSQNRNAIEASFCMVMPTTVRRP